jgi:UDP-galactopyranose mutase
MKTWKKIEETKKRTNDIGSLKKRNEEKIQKVISDLIVIFCRKYSTFSWSKSKNDK